MVRRRRRRFILVTAGLFILLLAVAIFILKPSGWIQDWRSNSSLDAAQAAMVHNQPEKAMLAARRALQLNNHNRRAQEILAELAGKSSAAIELEWRREILRQNPADPDAIATLCLAAVRAGEPLGEAAQHRFPSSRWRRYDKARLLPGGLLVVGDAVCSFNPIYGQGMTVAALEALALRNCLSRGTTDLPRRFFRATAKPIGQAWQLAAGGDLSLPEIQGTPPLSTRLLNGYMERLLTAAEYDIAAFEQFLKVAWLVDAPIRLLRPAMMWRAASANQRRQKRPTPLTATSSLKVS